MQKEILKQCKKCNSTKVIFVEYEMSHPQYYDGISEIECLDCGSRFGRWSGKELAQGEFESKNKENKICK